MDSNNKVAPLHPQPLKPADDIESIIADMRAGKMVIMMDDTERENEGDLIIAASLVRAEDINFMARYGRGLICLTLSAHRCRQLRLPPMVAYGDDLHHTAFTISIEAARGVTTGISAFDRAQTIRTAVKPDARPEDLVQPGHVFPLMAQPGGVLTRAGHTEAGCDLTRLAGLEPAAVIVEVLKEDGHMARRPDLERFAHEHDLKLGTIADLIRYRLQHEHTIERVAETQMKTEFGEFRLVAYQDAVENTLHMALIHGTLDPSKPTLVRVHMGNTLADVLSVNHSDSAWPLRSAMQRVAQAESGVLVILRKPETPRELVEQIVGLGAARGAANPAGPDKQVLRTYGLGAQILKDLGVQRMRVLSSPKTMHGISGFGLEVVEYVACE
ncbi:MAG: 3,4-dihydroxy-2-butanone-4-phosphate synthase [Nevskiaceae bacterium]|nr:MAG: 3,4-dihydroxy-2-butanone-4-phosphate synthase [Nevskiaceae bacterium]TBR74885.1 MAG: 3,4-dihydroxy-2-butanone-4-phosphate synthase [Nevskiaceae bacterium]